MHGFRTSLQHILAELERIDVLIRAQVWRAQSSQIADQEFQGIYVSEQEIEALLARPTGLPRWAGDSGLLSLPEINQTLAELSRQIDQSRIECLRQGISLRLVTLADRFHLSAFELDILLICLAPEIDLRYERLYAYLQDDINRKRPTVDLVLNLLVGAFDQKLTARKFFEPTAPLFKHRLLHLFDDPGYPQPPLLSRFLKVDDRLVDFLFDSDELAAEVRPYATRVAPATCLETVLLPASTKQRLAMLARGMDLQAAPLIFYFDGAYGVGKQTTAEALCREIGLNLLVVDGKRLACLEEHAFEATLRCIEREAALQEAALYWAHFDVLLAEEKESLRRRCLDLLEQRAGLTVLAGHKRWEPAGIPAGVSFIHLEFPRPGYVDRRQFWTMSLNGHSAVANDVDLAALAGKFRFSGGQIRDAARTAASLARWRDPDQSRLTMEDLYAACRVQSNQKLAGLAQKITPFYTWPDIVLPPDRLEQLREICNHVQYRAKVYGEWGFDRKLSLGKGLNVLFAGPSGTGKTMASEIIAGELRLDLYKIDLSTVISKYIGETEKNLGRIFAEAESSNAILLFDEADALFGKRTEIRDAHDRYANVEISYLLQKMEEYEGIVILTTNLRKNMDDAFVRRMQFTLDFPFPNQADRRRIWQQIWPAETPRSPELDLDFMARRFEIAGGNIRNIALAAAFLAADDGGTVTMTHLIRATRREYQKMGKVVVDGEFGEYAGLGRRSDRA